MIASAQIVLLGDIGATNARFALAVDGRLGPIKWIEVARYPSVADAIEVFRNVKTIPTASETGSALMRAKLAGLEPLSKRLCETSDDGGFSEADQRGTPASVADATM